MQGKGKKAAWHSGDNLSNGVSSVEDISKYKPADCGMGTSGKGQMPQGTYKGKVSSARGNFRFR